MSLYVPLTITLTPELKNKLASAAKADRRSVSNFIVGLIINKLEADAETERKDNGRKKEFIRN